MQYLTGGASRGGRYAQSFRSSLLNIWLSDVNTIRHIPSISSMFDPSFGVPFHPSISIVSHK